MISLGDAPKTKAHLMADFLELCIALGELDVMAHADALSIANDDSINDSPSEDPETSSAEHNVAQQVKALEWFEHFHYWKQAFGNAYPFEFQGNTLGYL